MENKYKIVVSYIQDLSVEIPSPESLLTIRNTIPEFQMKVDINSKPLKKKMIEVATTLSYSNANKKRETGFGRSESGDSGPEYRRFTRTKITFCKHVLLKHHEISRGGKF